MGQQKFVYVTYIKTTPQALWESITDPEFTSVYYWKTYVTRSRVELLSKSKKKMKISSV